MINTKFRIVVVSVGWESQGNGRRDKHIARNSSQVGWHVDRCVYAIVIFYNIHEYYNFIGIKNYIQIIFKIFRGYEKTESIMRPLCSKQLS